MAMYHNKPNITNFFTVWYKTEFGMATNFGNHL